MIAYIALGSNLGRREAAVLGALRALEGTGAVRVACLSSLYESEADGIEGAPRFVNAVAKVEPLLPPVDLLERLKAIEAGMGRTGGHHQSREIDLDLISYDTRTGVFGPLILPHPRFHTRAYVLTPLQEIAPDFVCPRTGKSVGHFLEGLDDSSRVERISGRRQG